MKSFGTEKLFVIKLIVFRFKYRMSFWRNFPGLVVSHFFIFWSDVNLTKFSDLEKIDLTPGIPGELSIIFLLNLLAYNEHSKLIVRILFCLF